MSSVKFQCRRHRKIDDLAPIAAFMDNNSNLHGWLWNDTHSFLGRGSGSLLFLRSSVKFQGRRFGSDLSKIARHVAAINSLDCWSGSTADDDGLLEILFIFPGKTLLYSTLTWVMYMHGIFFLAAMFMTLAWRHKHGCLKMVSCRSRAPPAVCNI